MYRAWLSAAPPMLLSRLTWVQPTGAVIEPPPERRAVTTPTSSSPPRPPGFGTVSDDARDVQAVALPLIVIDPPSSGAYPGSWALKGRAAAGEANAPYNARPSIAAHATWAARWGRLPNMAHPSVQRSTEVHEFPSHGCHSKQVWLEALAAVDRLVERSTAASEVQRDADGEHRVHAACCFPHDGWMPSVQAAEPEAS